MGVSLSILTSSIVSLWNWYSSEIALVGYEKEAEHRSNIWLLRGSSDCQIQGCTL
jgi:hypothetical protein